MVEWWTKPYYEAPISRLASNGKWRTKIVTGGHDKDATEIKAFLIPLGTEVPLCSGSELPESLADFLVADQLRN